ncbi:MAG TPA: peptidase domain-containing ABC transporter [Cyclobacteriaceae bacterium]|nr:peptidase domain-containing ABC transporter [Cyclobacteriaceae bacterium]
MSFKTILQKDLMDCGPACLAMICKHYGKSIALAAVREKTHIGKQGVSMLGISEAAESYGFRSLAAQLTYDQLIEEALLPCIIHWSQSHFVVLTKIKKKSFFNKAEKIEIADPAHGLVDLDHEAFKQNWISAKIDEKPVGVALLLEPTQDFFEREEDQAHSSNGIRFETVIGYVLRYRKQLMQLVFSLGIASLFQMLLPFLTQSIVDTGIQTENLHFVYIVLLAQVALFCGKLTVDFIRSWILLHISTRINVSILTDFFIKLMKLPVSFFDSKVTGDLLQRMGDHQRIETFLTGSSLNVLFSLISLCVFSAVLAYYNSVVFLVFLVSSVLYIGWIIIFLDKRRQLDYKKFQISAQEQSATIQMIQGMQEIKLQNCGRQVRWKWERIQAKLFKVNMKGLSLDQWQQSGALFLNEGKNILITFFCVKAVIEGQMTLGSMLAVQYIIGQLNGPLEQMIDFVKAFQHARISMERLNEIHCMEDEEPVQKSLIKKIPRGFARQLVGGKGTPDFPQTNLVAELTQDENMVRETVSSESLFPSITFDKVKFTYNGAGNNPVLKKISLEIPSGKTTAIVGVSGSGKTTLLKLLLKFYEPQKGRIYLDETPLSMMSHQVWRDHCGVVMQDSYIFSDTIARNIAVGVETIDLEQLRYAIKVANIEEFIQGLPLGLNTKIGPDGIGISMGQRQRVLIARAVYKNPDYIFLDEATNSLDAKNESVIIENLQRFFRGRTVVVVAHRLSTVKQADQIILLDKGKIAERGTHQELVNLKGNYYALIKNQLDLGD